MECMKGVKVTYQLGYGGMSMLLTTSVISFRSVSFSSSSSPNLYRCLKACAATQACL